MVPSRSPTHHIPFHQPSHFTTTTTCRHDRHVTLSYNNANTRPSPPPPFHHHPPPPPLWHVKTRLPPPRHDTNGRNDDTTTTNTCTTRQNTTATQNDTTTTPHHDANPQRTTTTGWTQGEPDRTHKGQPGGGWKGQAAGRTRYARFFFLFSFILLTAT